MATPQAPVLRTTNNYNMSADIPKNAVAQPFNSSNYLNNLKTSAAPSIDAKVSHYNASSYLESSTMMAINKNIDTNRIVNTNFKIAPSMAQTIKQVEMAPIEAVKKMEVTKAEEVTFKIDHI